MSYEVKLEQFSGPMQLLLELIEKEEMPITEVSLAAVTDGYLQHLSKNDVPAEELADFLVVATRLLLIKSKAILPALKTEEVEDTSKLALQLRMYKEFVTASRHLEERFGVLPMFARAPYKPTQEAGFFPPKKVDTAELRKSFASLLKRLAPFFALQKTSIERVVSVKERIKEIHKAILERSRLTFSEVVKGATSKVEVVVSFLALLELVKQQTVSIFQEGSFGNITITKSD